MNFQPDYKEGDKWVETIKEEVSKFRARFTPEFRAITDPSRTGIGVNSKNSWKENVSKFQVR